MTDKWKNKLWYTHTYEILFNLNKKGNSDACYNLDELEDIMPSEIIRELQKGKYHMVPLI